MKTIIIVSAIMLCVFSAGLAIRYNLNASSAQKDLNQERFNRMTSEEGLEKANARISSLEAELARTQSKVKGVEKALEQANAVNDDLKGRLDKASEYKDKLDAKIKELEQLAGPAPAKAAASNSAASQ